MNPMMMRKTALGLGLLSGLLTLACGGDPSKDPTPTSTAPSTPLPPHPPEPKVAYAFPNPTTEAELLHLSPTGHLLAKAEASLPLQSLKEMGFQVDGAFTSGAYRYLRLLPKENPHEALALLQKIQGVLYAEPDMRVELDAPITLNNPDPLMMSGMYSMDITEAKKAWTTFGFGPHTPYLADVDTGINWKHEDFTRADGTSLVAHAFSWWDRKNANTFLLGGEYSEANPIDYAGTDLVTTDDDGHGSHTAGTIAAIGNNGKGVAGVCWNSKLISYTGFAPKGATGNTTWAIYTSLHHLAKWKQANQVTQTIPVNMSLGGAYPSYFALDMIQEGLENDLVVIASSGNEGQALARYPAAYTGVITVGASNGRDKKVHFSSMGPHVSVAAPGISILSLHPTQNAGYVSMSGTSMATPFVTGLVGYMLSFNPTLKPAQIQAYLEKNTDDIEDPGFDIKTGWGRVNVYKTIQAVVRDVQAGTPPPAPSVKAPLCVRVKNTYQGDTTWFYNSTVYLFEANSDGSIKNYLACARTSLDREVATFNLTRPGKYVYTTLINTWPLSGGVEVTAGQTSIPEQSLTTQQPRITLQTLGDAGTAASTNVILTLYDSTGAVLQTVNAATVKETYAGWMESGKTYLVGVKAASAEGLGEYALWMGSRYFAEATAPGSFGTPQNLGSQSQTKTAGQAIELNKIYNGNLSSATAEDFYTITLP